MRISSLNFARVPKAMPLVHLHFQLEILNRNAISDIENFRKIILESSQNISETTSCFVFENYMLWLTFWFIFF